MRSLSVSQVNEEGGGSSVPGSPRHLGSFCYLLHHFGDFVLLDGSLKGWKGNPQACTCGPRERLLAAATVGPCCILVVRSLSMSAERGGECAFWAAWNPHRNCPEPPCCLRWFPLCPILPTPAFAHTFPVVPAPTPPGILQLPPLPLCTQAPLGLCRHSPRLALKSLLLTL